MTRSISLTDIVRGQIQQKHSFLLSTSLLALISCSTQEYNAPLSKDGTPIYASAKAIIDADGDGVRAAIDCDDADASVGRPSKWYRDRDSDGYGTRRRYVFDCTQPVGYVANRQDCDDRSSSIYPGAPEYCNGVDDNCDRTIDEDTALDAIVWYLDSDGDGYGDSLYSTTSCTAPSSYVSNNSDCDDSSGSISPVASEYCNSIDDNCDGTVDEDSALDAIVWYLDADSDGYGDASYTTTACSVPSGYVSNATDCDDTTSLANPGLTEICSDGIDNDCDGTADSCGLSGTYSLSSADAKLDGEAVNDVAGYSVAGAGDINSDGYADLLVGSHGDDSDTSRTGSVYLVLGPVSGETNLSTSYAKFNGEAAGDITGFPLASGGDINNDGYDDILIGACRESSASSWAGAMYVVLGPASAGTMSLSTADAKVTGEEAGTYLGFPVASAGDLNSDGYGDVLTAAHMESTGGTRAGAAYLLSGPLSGTMSVTTATAKFIGENSWDYAGNSLAGVGDVDGDSIDDILISAYLEDTGGSDAGAAYLILGPASGEIDLSSADAKLTGEYSGDHAGYLVGKAGDINADGYSDLLIGAYNSDAGGTDSGAAYVVLGPVSGTNSLSTATAKLTGEAASDYAGYSVSGADINNDSYSDILVGAYYNNNAGSDAGAVYLVNGPITGTISLSSADAIFEGEASGDLAGRFASFAGDTNADGIEDIIIDAEHNDATASNSGAAYIIFGSGL